MNMMKAIIVEQSGSPEVLPIRQIHRTEPDTGLVLVRIRAFGLNRSEMFTRQGFSPDVTFPRILGIEAVGEVEQDPSGHYQAGQKVAAVMGGMGRQYNGGGGGEGGLSLLRAPSLLKNRPLGGFRAASLTFFSPPGFPPPRVDNPPRQTIFLG